VSEALASRPSTSLPVVRCRKVTTLWERFRGLMASPPPSPGEGLWFPDCSAVHTAFVRSAIDLIFLRDRQIVRVCAGVPPWRVVGCRGADSVVELRSGEAQRLGLTVGQPLNIETTPTLSRRRV
jgi:uncharacterized protein